jgi:hypothetical protein
MQNYSTQIEEALNLGCTIDGCKKLFDNFIKNQSLKIKTETELLKIIKVFLHRKKIAVQKNNHNSALRNRDCLTLSIITCLLAARYGYPVSIGKPDPLSRYFHSVIITSEGKMFKIAGKSSWYGFKEMKPERVVKRLKLFNPIISSVDYVKNRIRYRCKSH